MKLFMKSKDGEWTEVPWREEKFTNEMHAMSVRGPFRLEKTWVARMATTVQGPVELEVRTATTSPEVVCSGRLNTEKSYRFSWVMYFTETRSLQVALM